MSFSWDNGSEQQGQGFTVTGNRDSGDWYSIDPGTLALFGVFNFGSGDPYGTYSLPTVENPGQGLPRERVDQNEEPSEGQEHFADDGDPFNDGEAPTRQTVQSWLEDLADSVDDFVYILAYDVGGSSTVYQGSYSVGDGPTVNFSSDGEGNYGQWVGPSSGSNDDFMF